MSCYCGHHTAAELRRYERTTHALARQHTQPVRTGAVYALAMCALRMEPRAFCALAGHGAHAHRHVRTLLDLERLAQAPLLLWRARSSRERIDR